MSEGKRGLSIKVGSWVDIAFFIFVIVVLVVTLLLLMEGGI